MHICVCFPYAGLRLQVILGDSLRVCPPRGWRENPRSMLMFNTEYHNNVSTLEIICSLPELPSVMIRATVVALVDICKILVQTSLMFFRIWFDPQETTANKPTTRGKGENFWNREADVVERLLESWPWTWWVHVREKARRCGAPAAEMISISCVMVCYSVLFLILHLSTWANNLWNVFSCVWCNLISNLQGLENPRIYDSS